MSQPILETPEETCLCGHGESMHVDGCEQCFDITCGCKEFEPQADEYEKLQEMEIDTI